ncbi:MAG TPA: SprT family zinc-dependent metalloprotease [Thermoanaerobaculia bacterium]|nr:SprT family zinc-dependent metalloprotease [Thermoanaerobaculia bacterium]
MKAATPHQIRIDGRRIEYRVVRSKVARKFRLRVGPSGVEVVQPADRSGGDLSAFLNRHGAWILDQLERAERLRGVRRPTQRRAGEILFRGEPTRLRIQMTDSRMRGNTIHRSGCEIVIRKGSGSRIPVERSLENWLRKQARAEIERQLSAITARLRQSRGRLYVMGQRTKWGNCSASRNLSFNWRLILAPGFVLRYLVTHEAVHLAIPDHSAKFWLTVQSLCRETEVAKQWLCRHHAQLTIDLGKALVGGVNY